jgi:hypothetical protein
VLTLDEGTGTQAQAVGALLPLLAVGKIGQGGTPKTIVHISIIQWKEGVSAADKQRALDGVKEMAAKIPGMKNVWTKAVRVQPEGYHDAFVIEFENQAAVDRYAKDPVHDAWTESFAKIREASISPQITNE